MLVYVGFQVSEMFPWRRQQPCSFWSHLLGKYVNFMNELPEVTVITSLLGNLWFAVRTDCCPQGEYGIKC